ncbi:hypothetical protein DIPPA_24876 [Diplonema papillatum]|nr:hypothetical protein DIPPA_21109 [Diplonema papillatum]KAJ9451557.1 hypothetical protein DIPPA_24876 [Diplonema papillatum]
MPVSSGGRMRGTLWRPSSGTIETPRAVSGLGGGVERRGPWQPAEEEEEEEVRFQEDDVLDLIDKVTERQGSDPWLQLYNTASKARARRESSQKAGRQVMEALDRQLAAQQRKTVCLSKGEPSPWARLHQQAAHPRPDSEGGGSRIPVITSYARGLTPKHDVIYRLTSPTVGRRSAGRTESPKPQRRSHSRGLHDRLYNERNALARRRGEREAERVARETKGMRATPEINRPAAGRSSFLGSSRAGSPSRGASQPQARPRDADFDSVAFFAPEATSVAEIRAAPRAGTDTPSVGGGRDQHQLQPQQQHRQQQEPRLQQQHQQREVRRTNTSSSSSTMRRCDVESINKEDESKEASRGRAEVQPQGPARGGPPMVVVDSDEDEDDDDDDESDGDEFKDVLPSPPDGPLPPRGAPLKAQPALLRPAGVHHKSPSPSFHSASPTSGASTALGAASTAAPRLRFREGAEVTCVTAGGGTFGTIVAVRENGHAYRIATAAGDLYAGEDTDEFVSDAGKKYFVMKSPEGRVGIAYQDVFVTDLQRDSAAEAVGVPIGGRITAVDKVAVKTQKDIETALRLAPVGAPFAIHVLAASRGTSPSKSPPSPGSLTYGHKSPAGSRGGGVAVKMHTRPGPARSPAPPPVKTPTAASSSVSAPGVSSPRGSAYQSAWSEQGKAAPGPRAFKKMALGGSVKGGDAHGRESTPSAGLRSPPASMAPSSYLLAAVTAAKSPPPPQPTRLRPARKVPRPRLPPPEG